jgi:hypothetical protein
MHFVKSVFLRNETELASQGHVNSMASLLLGLLYRVL